MTPRFMLTIALILGITATINTWIDYYQINAMKTRIAVLEARK